MIYLAFLDHIQIGGYNVKVEEEGAYPVVRAVERMSSQKLYNKKLGCVFSLRIFENGLSWVILSMLKHFLQRNLVGRRFYSYKNSFSSF